MAYEINVALNGRHYFATHERSITTSVQAEKTYKDFQERFPEKDGFTLSIKYNPEISYGCWFNEEGEFVNGYYHQTK